MFGEEFAGIHTMGSVMGTSIHAARLLLVETEIAGGCLGVDFRDFLSRMHKIIYLHIKRMHVDVAIRAGVGTETAADTPILNDNLQTVTSADGTYGAADHAQRIFAVAAGCSDEILIPAQPIANQSADALVGVSAGADALVASSTAFEI